MGFKKENYTRMGITIPVLIGFCLCVFVPKNIANSLNPPGSCNIGVLEEPRPTSRAKGTRHAKSTAHTYRNADWVGLNNGRIKDEKYISTSLAGGISSACLTLNNFNFKIPEGSEITGMEIYVEGKVEGDSTDVRTKNLYLLDASGNPMGNNFNNAISIGDDWGSESNKWKYGSGGYNWGGILSRDLLNSPEFGIHLEVKNHSDNNAEVFIDKIEVILYYKPGASICLGDTHKCISFFGPRTSDILGYNWTLPPGFRELEDDEAKVFNVFLTDTTLPGVYEICVDIEYADGNDQCCRTFEVLDCTPSTVGDRVWEDVNGDGIQDEGEPGIEGISLELYNDIDQLVGNTTSGADGNYSFDNVLFGCYYVKATGLNGYLPSIGANNFLDGSNGYACTEYFTVDPDVSITDVDLGLVQPAKISGTIWHDANANGTFEDESTIEGITLELEGPVGSRSTTTDGSGNYTFDDLVPGDYKITSSLLDRYEFTDSGIGEVDVDSDLNSNGMVEVTGLVSATEVNDIDGGMFKRGTIGNYVWYDRNVNGIQDDGEYGIPGVKVVLRNNDGQVGSSTTDSSGYYDLTRVRPDEYYLSYDIDDQYIISIPNAGDDDTTDSDVEALQDAMRTSNFTFSSCDSISDLDAGFIFKPGTIRGQVWSDDNRDGQRQPDESRQLSTSVTLYSGTDDEIENKQVDADGSYYFDQLQPADYYVKFDAIEDHVYSSPDVGDDDSDSDITDTDNGTTDLISITPDLTVPNVDAGYAYLVSSISGTVWKDEDRNHMRGADETSIRDISVNLYSGNGDSVASTTTDASGNYRFDELRKGDYYITFSAVEDYLFVTAFQGEAGENSDVSQSITDGSTDNISLSADTDVTNIDAGYILEVGTIIGETWEDIDLDGVNNDQVSFEGVEVKLFDEDNDEVRNTTTDGDGTYTFDLVPVGDYYVHFELPTDWIFTESNGDVSEPQNSDVNDANGEGTTEMVSLEDQGDEQELDGGYVINQGRLEGIVWKDNDEDGQRQQEESGMEGVGITLYDNANNEIANTTSSGEGDYSFEEITAGDYYIKVDIPDDNIFTPADQGDDSTDSDINEANGEGTTATMEILTGRRTTSADAGSVDDFGNIHGVAWCDVNEDGILEASEELIDEIKVDLYTEDGSLVESTTTSNGGAYSFLEVASGTYYLVFADEDDKNFTLPSAGDDDLINSAVNSSLTNGSTFVFRVGTGNKDYIRNAGYQYLPGSISGHAWKDDNCNTTNDDNSPFSGISVTLFDVANNEISTTTTDEQGNYNFQDVRRGDYYVVFGGDNNYLQFTSTQSGDSDITNSTADGGTNIFEVIANRETTDIDAGYLYALGSISGQAWKDDNSNASNDDNSPFQGIAVTLYDSSNGEITSTTTNENGNYNFQEIRFGDYYVVFGADEDYLMIPSSQSEDSDITNSTAEGGSNIFEVLPNKETAGIDGGYLYARGSVSGNAWIDVNDNGLDDDNDPFQNVTVTLYNSAGEVGSTSTDGNGNYAFNDIYFGEYYVTFSSQENYLFAQADAGDDTIDSDITGTNGEGSTDIFQILPNTATENIDGGYFLAVGSVSGTAWIDDNDNATNDESNGFEGIEVTLFSTSGDRTTTTTSADGSYLFENVLMGTYSVSFQSQDDYDFVAPGNGDEDKDSDVTGANGEGSTDEITVNPRIETMHVDAGYVLGKGTISGTAWIDDNGNSTNDDNNGYEGIEVTLLTSTGDRTSTTTNADGTYIFEDVFPGNYSLSFATREGYEFVTPNVGEDNVDSDVTGANGEGSTDEITVNPRQDVVDIDAGYLLLTGSVSGTAWADPNGNSINDDGAEIEGLEVTLISTEGEQTQTTTTDANGYYLFEEVVPGSYNLSFEVRPDFDFVIPFAGDDEEDSDVTGAHGDGTTDNFAVRANQETAYLNAGYRLATGTVSGKAWMDINGNDINDDDLGFEGIEVTLFTATGEQTTATTNADGYFSFDRVVPGTYSIVFEGRENYEFVTPNVGEEDQDSDVTGANGDGSTDEFTVSPREEVMNIDAGYLMLRGGIAGSAWKDENGNGIYDGEPPFANVTVNLFNESGEVVDTRETNENGNYMFDDLVEGNYYIVFAGQDNYKFTIAGEGNADQDSDVTAANGDGSTDIFSVNAGGLSEDIDAGYVKTEGSICGFIWIDDNSRDGVNSEGDEFGAEVLVNLLDSNGEGIAEVITDPDGGYCFNNIGTGTYQVRFSLSDGQEFVAPKQGDDAGRDSDVTDTENGRTDLIELNDGDELFYDAGIQTIEIIKGSITGKVWKDNNGDNIYNEGDDLVEGLGMNLLSDIGAILGTTATGPDGTYSFDDLDDGRYVVLFENREGQEFVEEGAGDNESTDSDVISTVDTTGSFGITDVIIIEGGQDIADVDAGVFMEMMMEFGSISGTAFRDENANNIDDDNSGLNGFEIRLFSASGEELANTTTGNGGNYNFSDLSDGSYYVVFENKDNYEFVQADEGEDDTIDSDVTGSNGNGSTDPFEIVDAADIENIDAGYFTEQELYSLSGRVFIDENGNNIDDDEPGLEGASVALILAAGFEPPISVVTTGADGSYSFDNLPVGGYIVLFQLDDMARTFVSPNEGDDDSIDSDVISDADFQGQTDQIQLTSNVIDVDAGTTVLETSEKGSICGTAWNDENKNNINDDNAPLSGIEVKLFDGDEELAVTTTDSDGKYCFEDLEERDYYVSFSSIADYQYVTPNEGDDQSVDSDVTGDSGEGTTNTFFVQGETKLENIDAGYYTDQELYSIRGKAFIDANGNNIDNEESGLEGVQVFLLDSLDMELAVTMTDAEGNYSFNNLTPNSYVVVFAQAAEREFVSANEGDDDAIDSDVEFVRDGLGATNIIVLTSSVNDVDAGFTDIEVILKGSICGTAWIDDNKNNINDDNAPLGDLEVILYDGAGEEQAVAITDNSGNYTFSDLDEGDYYVFFDPQTDYQYVSAEEGEDDSIDSDVTGDNGDGTTSTVSIQGDLKIELDAGYYTDLELYSIRGKAFIDANENNVDDGEEGLVGVQVALLDSLDAELEVTTTDGDGNYSFNNLTPNSYVVVFAQAEEREFVSANEGDDDTIDSDVEFIQDGLGATNIIVLTNSVNDVDAGFTDIEVSINGSISGRAWKDNNANGINDDDSPLSGIQVFLVDSLDVQTAMTTTDDAGNYSFGDLEFGTYAIVFMLPADHRFTDANQGDDDTIDSDPGFIQDDLASTRLIILNGNVTNVDVGFVPNDVMDTGSISGLAWRDVNSNNLNDDNTPYAGVEVKLLSENGETIETVTTETDGRYSFGNLDDGTYSIQFERKDQNEFSNANEGDDDTIDSDVLDDSGNTDVIVIAENADIENVDAGYTTDQAFYSISGRAWIDTDEDNLNNDNAPFAGIQVFLIDSLDAQAATTTTDSLGNYSFDNVVEGAYGVVFTLPEDYEFSDPNVGDDDTIDSDILFTQNNLGSSDKIDLTANVENVDAGYKGIERVGLSIAGKAFIDSDENGLDDDGNPYANVTVALFDTSGVEISRISTDDMGAYSFNELDSGAYYVSFWIDSTYVFTTANEGDDDTIDSDVTIIGDGNGSTDNIDLVTSITDIDAGYISTDTMMIAMGNLAGVVWEDTSTDGLRQGDEPGVENIEVRLIDNNGEQVGSTTTDGSGNYSFENVNVGSYTVRFIIGDTQTFVLADTGEDDTIDSDVIDGEGNTAMITIIADSTLQNVDAGLLTELPQASLCGNVWIDANEDGLNDEGEDKIIGILINIYNENGEYIDSTRTTTGGFYSFTDLLGGYYYLEFDTEGDYTFTDADVGEDDGFDSDVTGENGEGTTAVFLGTGKIKLDAGLILETGSYISGKVWGDTDEDNTFGEDDIVFEGYEVFLVNRLARVIASTTTGANGSYRFDLTDSGEYAVFFATNDETTFVEANASGDDKTDSDVVEVIEINGTFGTTDLISYNAGQRIKNVDAGIESTIVKAESLNGVVWMDDNEDGIRQDDESLLAGIEVNVIGADGQVVTSTTTDSDGAYSITDLESGDYNVQFVLGSGEFVAANQGDNDSLDSDVEDLENGNTATFTFEAGTVQSFDAGVMGDVQVNTICGTLWNDEDQNGLNDGEQGRRDVKVYLEQGGEAIDSTSTAADGSYAFANLETGNYRIVFEAVDGYSFTAQDVGDDDTVDSDVNSSGISAEVSVEGKVTIDAGVSFSVVGITGKVWGDRNEDNVFGEEDILIEGHMVFLLNRTARVIQTTTTAADGTYRFEGVAPGSYAVFFDVGVDDMFVEANASDDESTDSDVLEVITQIGPYGATEFVNYEENGTIRNIDAGLIRTPSSTGLVAGVVWLDNEQDGIRQDDEELFSGIAVTLFTTDGTEVNSATTDDAGAYEFSNVSPGEYYVVFTLLGREFVAANQGDDDRVDSDVEDLGSGRTANFEVEIDVTTMMDAGVQPAQTGVCGTVWFDFNENGQRDNDEMGIPNNEVKLYSAAGEQIAVTETNETGAYSFPDAENGEYYVEVFLEGAFSFTEMKIGDEATDSDITEANGDGTSDTFTYEGGLIKVDAGQISIVASFISGKVWEDKDGDNILNNDDDVVAELNVYLQFDGEIIDTAITEPDGTYIFENISVGTYVVLFEQRDGTFFTLANIPEEENKDSDVLGTIEIGGENFGFTEDIFIGSGQVKVNVDGGITQNELNPGSISGLIWLDENDDSKNNEDEGPIEGVIVTLINGTGGIAGMMDVPADGTYSFENLAPGSYLVQFTIPAEFSFVEADQGEDNEDSDVLLFDGPMGVTAEIVVGDGEDVVNVDAGVKPVTVNFSTIGDQVWLDIDADGILDDDEIGMNDVNVELFDAVTGVMVSSMLTIDHPELRDPGFYQFTDLPNGDYYLRFKLPNGYIFSNPRMGTETIKDSDVTGMNGTGTTNTVTVDRIKMTDIDVGAIKTTKSVVGDFVFNDRNSNGIQDANEGGINNIRVRLFDTENRQVAQTFTQYNRAMDRGGYFSFKVDPGTYFLRFDISQGLSFTQTDQGDDDEKDSDVTGDNGFGTTALFEVDLSETNLSLDAGLITEPANLGNYLWVDGNSNGVQDATEDGFNGVEVSLYDKDNNLMISTTTVSNNGQDGYYLFENISAGQYYISFDLPQEYVSTIANVGGNDAEDSDITDVFGKGTTSLFTLSSGEDELDIDGGIVLGSSIGDYVWEDADGDGIQDNSEPGAEGVFVTLLDETGTLVDTTRTDVRGEYVFDGLRVGDYTLAFDLPVDRASTVANSGSDDDLDSDVDEDGKSPVITVGYDEDIDNVDVGLVSNTVAFNSSVENSLIAKVYPNPTMRFVTISTNDIYQEDTDLKEVQIYSDKGALVRSYNDLKSFKNAGTKSYELDLEGVRPGVYFIKAKVGRLTYNKKLILINN